MSNLKENIQLVRQAKKRGLTVNHWRVWSDVVKLAGGIVVIGFKLLGCWNPIREGWRMIRNVCRRSKTTR